MNLQRVTATLLPRLRLCRSLSRPRILGVTARSLSEDAPRPAPAPNRAQAAGLTLHKVTPSDRFILIWAGNYKNMSEVPDFVSQDKMEMARNKYRIKVNILICLLLAVGCGFMIYSGKDMARRGETIQKMNIEWHRQLKEQYEKEKAAGLHPEDEDE